MKLKKKYSTRKQQQMLDEALRLRSQGMSLRGIAKKLFISKGTVCNWIANFAEPMQIQPMKGVNKIHKTIDAEKLDKLPAQEQIAKLKEALRRAELKADLYDEMINVAEAKFKVGIRKKAGARQ